MKEKSKYPKNCPLCHDGVLIYSSAGSHTVVYACDKCTCLVHKDRITGRGKILGLGTQVRKE